MRTLGESVFNARFFEGGPVSCEADSAFTPERMPSDIEGEEEDEELEANEKFVDFIVLVVVPSPNTLGENRESWETPLREGIFNIFPMRALVRVEIVQEEIPPINMRVKEPVPVKAG